jgi:hypothetical protein
MPAGIVKITTATTLATTSAIRAAMCALTLLEAIRRSSVTTGSAAAMVESVLLLKGS